MCMEDIRIGRRTLSRSIIINTTPTVAVQVFPNSDDRIALILGAPAAGNLTYSDQSKPLTATGFIVGAGQPPIILKLSDVGDIVRHQWWVVDDGTGRSGMAVETLLADK